MKQLRILLVDDHELVRRGYKVIVLGVGFQLLVGRQIPQRVRQLCFVRGVGNPICKTDMLEQAIMQDINLKRSLHPHLFDGPKGHASP